MPVLVAIWLLIAYSEPVASCWLLSLLNTVTANGVPVLKRCSTVLSEFCGTVNCTVVGFMVVMVTMPGEVDWVTYLPGSTSRKPTRPATGAVM